MCICGAVKIGLGATVKLIRLYLEETVQHRRLTSSVCAFHLGISLGLCSLGRRATSEGPRCSKRTLGHVGGLVNRQSLVASRYNRHAGSCTAGTGIGERWRQMVDPTGIGSKAASLRPGM